MYVVLVSGELFLSNDMNSSNFKQQKINLCCQYLHSVYRSSFFYLFHLSRFTTTNTCGCIAKKDELILLLLQQSHTPKNIQNYDVIYRLVSF